MPKLDNRFVRNVPGPDAGKREASYWDDRLPALGVRVLASGSRSWLVRYRVGRRQRYVTLGAVTNIDAGKARREAERIVAGAKLGHDERIVIEQRREAAQVHDDRQFLAIVSLYVKRHVEANLKPRSQTEIRRALERQALPLHGKDVDAITRRDVAACIEQVAANSGPIGGNRFRSYLSGLFSWAMRQGLVESNPVIGAGTPAQEKSRERTLAPAEIAALWRATDGPGDHDAILRLLLLTGQRREEVAAMRWKEIDLDQALWSLPGSRTKNARPHDVPLSDPAVAVISNRPRRSDRDLVFGEGKGGYSGWSRAKLRLDAKIACMAGAPLAPWRLHDLRRTAVTRMAEMGIAPHIVEAVVNHVSGYRAGVAGIYNRATYSIEKREALDRWGWHVLELVQAVTCPQSAATR